MRRRAALVVVALGLLAARRSPPVSFWEDGSPSTLHPLWAVTTRDLRAQAPIFDPLVRRGPDGWVSDLATAIHAEGGRVELTLRTDLRWHDGERFGPDDVCATVEALRDRDHPTPLGSRLGHRLGHCGAHPSDPNKVLVHLADTSELDPFEPLAFPVLPAHLGPLDAEDHQLATSPVGTGAWRAHLASGGVIYTPTGAPHAPPGLPQLRLVPLPVDPTDRDRAWNGSGAQGWPRLPAAEVPAHRDREGIALVPYPLDLVLVAHLDTSEPPLSDPAAREALDHALDRALLCNELVGGWPDAISPPCRPSTGPFLARSEGRNAGVGAVPPTLVATETPRDLVVAIPTELDVDPTRLGELLAAAWAPHHVVIEPVAMGELLATDTMERRRRWAVVVDTRLPAWDDLTPELAVNGARNWFGLAQPDLLAALADHTPEGRRTQHALLADLRPMLPLIEVHAMSAWSSRIRPLWMTPTDGLGAMERWGFATP